ncbi:MAG TPA: hypothetical protein VGC95_12945, partial [Chitinophagaceae bacterium]
MTGLRFRIGVLMVSMVFFAHAQKQKKADEVTLRNLQHHISYLADDKLEGRRTGSAGEQLAMQYISDQFKLDGIQPKGTDGYIQAFEINEGKEISAGTSFSINGHALLINDDYFPFAYSPDVKIEALPAISVQESGMPWFINLKETIEENTTNPHFDLYDHLHQQAIDFKKKGATALIFYDTGSGEDQVHFEAKDRSPVTAIPVVYVTK